MTTRQKMLVQTSFGSIEPIADVAGALFYDSLFAIDPSLRQMFRGDIEEQARKLMQMLTVAVKSLDRLEQLIPVLEDLGRRHVRYGVTDQQYGVVGIALLMTLEKGLGPVFTDEVREAWTIAYDTLAGVMQRAARESLMVPAAASTMAQASVN